MRSLVVAAVVAAAIGIAGCDVRTSPELIEGVAGETILIASTATGFEALLSGTLGIGDGGCLVLLPTEPSDGPGRPPAVVWPPGTRPLDLPSGGVVLPGGREIAVGDYVELGGGSVDATEDYLPEIPPGCSLNEGRVRVISSE